MHGGQTHDHVARMSMMYNNHYSSGAGDHDGMMDMRTRYLQLQKRYQVKGCKQLLGTLSVCVFCIDLDGCFRSK